MSTKYRAWLAMAEIKPVEILRETEKMVVISSPDCVFYKNGERRELKRTDDWAYFGTWQEAHAFLVQDAESKINRCKERLCDAEKKYAKIKEMQEPKT